MGSLSDHGLTEPPGLIEISLNEGASVRDAIQALRIPEERVKLAFVNHAGAFLDQPLKEGDRVSFFPAEYPVFADWEGIVLKRDGHETIKEGKMKKWKCSICGYIYDPSKGDPENGINPGTAFENIPDDWVCPLCGAGKDMFEAE